MNIDINTWDKVPHGHVLRGEHWTIAIFEKETHFWAHVKYLDDGQTRIGFACRTEAVTWSINTLEGMISGREREEGVL